MPEEARRMRVAANDQPSQATFLCLTEHTNDDPAPFYVWEQKSAGLNRGDLFVGENICSRPRIGNRLCYGSASRVDSNPMDERVAQR
jgi:hypothetical protein